MSTNDPHSKGRDSSEPAVEARKKEPAPPVRPASEEEPFPRENRRRSSPALRLSAWLLALVLLLIILGWALGTIL